ncbi:MAG TPA: bifunctional 2-keto-4-hydroxyglutarate aldolase/2-keto-3-deoxy-6-phosphogluconate aldolase [Bacillota bacterium]|nr:bifunctional 2-keto-4-hydroxyglutarate aldolase/2-keto-3-deoxy-6-phosphogluconate aldolase [Bacillota bacterium]
MIPKLKHMQRIIDTGVIAVIRANSSEEALKIAEAVRSGGIDIIEITFTVPGALDVIKDLKRAYPGEEILLGAGTVLDAEAARLALLAGAEFVVSPVFNPEMVRLCNRYQKISMPGCTSITEMVQAMEAGADVIKLFPGSAFGPSIVKAIKGPLPQVVIIPTGGVSLDNVQEWIKNGCIAVGVGGELTKGAAKGDFAAVQEQARLFVEKVKAARQ